MKMGLIDKVVGMFSGGVFDKVKTYAIVALLVLAGGMFAYGLSQKVSIANLNTKVTQQGGEIAKKDLELSRLGLEVVKARAVNDQNLTELKIIQESYSRTVERLTTMNKELDKAKVRIDSLKGYINTFDKPGDDGPIAPVLGATIEQINKLESGGGVK
jgi:uncharacterized protein HemX